MFAPVVKGALIQLDADTTHIAFVDNPGTTYEKEVSRIDANTFIDIEKRLDNLAALMKEGGRIYELEKKLKKLLETRDPTTSPSTSPSEVPSSSPSTAPSSSPSLSPTNMRLPIRLWSVCTPLVDMIEMTT